MNRETIEKAAQSWAKGEITKSRIERAERVFKVGAEWRINSVWHDVQKELPAPDKTVIAEYIISVDKHGFCFYIRGAEIIRWAYLEDLLPDRKEVQP